MQLNLKIRIRLKIEVYGEVSNLVKNNFGLRSSANTCCRNCTAVALKC